MVPPIKHGYSTAKPKVYRCWCAIRSRCNDINCKDYPYYGGRGIKVCRRWDSFENFLADMGEPPTSNHQIDRIDNNGNYTPKNCRWATRSEQARNRREPVNKKLTYAQQDQVRALRATGRYKLRELGAIFGVSIGYIGGVVSR